MNEKMEELEKQVVEMKIQNQHIETNEPWKTNIKRKIIIGVGIAVVVIIVIIVSLKLYKSNFSNDDIHSTACTEEAKICPNGSSVSRTGSNCAFAPCALTNISLSESNARVIAEKSCIKGGKALATGTYNKNSKSWWYDANLDSAGESCNPACVVSEKTKTVKINWRCTGLKDIHTPD